MLKRTKSFVFGIVTAVAVVYAAAQFGFVKIDFTVTEKGQTALDQTSALIDTATDHVSEIFKDETAETE